MAQEIKFVVTTTNYYFNFEVDVKRRTLTCTVHGKYSDGRWDYLFYQTEGASRLFGLKENWNGAFDKMWANIERRLGINKDFTKAIDELKVHIKAKIGETQTLSSPNT